MVQNDPSGLALDPTLLYVNGQATGLNVTVQDNTGLTIAAASDVSITGERSKTIRQAANRFV